MPAGDAISKQCRTRVIGNHIPHAITRTREVCRSVNELSYVRTMLRTFSYTNTWTCIFHHCARHAYNHKKTWRTARLCLQSNADISSKEKC